MVVEAQGPRGGVVLVVVVRSGRCVLTSSEGGNSAEEKKKSGSRRTKCGGCWEDVRKKQGNSQQHTFMTFDGHYYLPQVSMADNNGPLIYCAGCIDSMAERALIYCPQNKALKS